MQYQHDLTHPTLTRVAAKLDAWRKSHGPPTPIPDEIWLAVLEMAEGRSACSLCRALRLNPATLRRKQTELLAAQRSTKKARLTGDFVPAEFVEWLSPELGLIGPLKLKLNFPSGTRLKLSLESSPVNGLVALLRELVR